MYQQSKKIWISLMFLACLFQIKIAQGQDLWSLERCIEHATKNNISILQNELQMQQAGLDVRQTNLSRYPTLNGSMGQAYNFGRTVDPITNTFQNQTVGSSFFQLATNGTIYRGSQINNTSKAQQLAFLASQKDLEVVVNNIGLSVSNFYLQLLLAKELEKTADLRKATTQEQVDRMEKLVAAGALSRDNLLNLKAQLANDEVTRINAVNQVKIAKLNLVLLLQLPYSDNFDIVVPAEELEPSLVADQIGDIYQYASNNQPEIKAAELRNQSAEKNLSVAKGGFLPSLGYSANINSTYSDRFIEVTGLELTGTQTVGFLNGDPTQLVLAPTFRPLTQTTPFGTQFRNNLGQQFSVFLSVPILNGGQNKINVQRAKININQAQLNLDQNKNTLYQNVSQAYVDYQTALTRNNANEANLEAQKENYEFAKIRFEQGAINSIDFGNIRTAYETAISTQLQTKYELIFRSKVIDFYLGKPIKL